MQQVMKVVDHTQNRRRLLDAEGKTGTTLR